MSERPDSTESDTETRDTVEGGDASDTVGGGDAGDAGGQEGGADQA